MTPQEIKKLAAKVKKNLQVTKVTCTRSIKGRGGEVFVGFSAAYESTQDDSLRGVDSTMEEDSDSFMTLEEAKMASLVLGAQVDKAAVQRANAGGVLSNEEAATAIQAIDKNYATLIFKTFSG